MEKEMERKTNIIVNYYQKGHYMYNEDTWDDSCTIENEKDLFLTCKSWHIKSSSSFNDYPFGGLFSFNNLTFQKQNIIVDDNGEVFYGEKQDCDKPEYFEDVKVSFNEWLENLKVRLPKLREARDKRLKEQSERRKFEELSKKYGLD
jgi:hypothetical protein